MILLVLCAALASKNDYNSGDSAVKKTSSISYILEDSYPDGLISKCTSPWQYFNFTTNTCECGDVPNDDIIICKVGQNLEILYRSS